MTVPHFAVTLEGTIQQFADLREAFSRKRKWDALEDAERSLETALARAFRKQGRLFMAALDRKAAALNAGLEEAAGDVIPPDWEAVFAAAAAETLADFQDPITAAAQDALGLAGQSALDEFGIDLTFDLENPRAVAHLREVGAKRVTGIADATRDELRGVIRRGAQAGQSYDSIASEIRQRFVGFSNQRAHLVAVTELGDAYEAGNAAAVEMMQDSGLVMEKRWSTTGDGNVDPICEANAAQGWIDFEDAFASGDDTPTAHPGCRCSALYRRAQAAA